MAITSQSPWSHISNNLNIYRSENYLGICKPALQSQLFDSIVVSFLSVKVMEVPGIEPGASHMQSALYHWATPPFLFQLPGAVKSFYVQNWVPTMAQPFPINTHSVDAKLSV